MGTCPDGGGAGGGTTGRVPLTGLDAVFVACAGFVAGAVNAVAGGGSLVSFPALVAAGLPPLTANVTNTVAVWPGYLGGVAAYRRELAGLRDRVVAVAPAAVLGGVAGAALLLVAPESVFEVVVPALVAGSCALLAAQDRLAAAVRRRARHDATGFAVQATTFVAAAYGAYFGGGLGVILLAAFGILLPLSLQDANALKSALSLVINSVALVAFVALAPVDWGAVAVVAPASLAGGYLGGGLARRLHRSHLRGAVIAVGLIAAVALAVT